MRIAQRSVAALVLTAAALAFGCQDASQLTQPEAGLSPESGSVPAFSVTAAAAAGTETRITTLGASEPAISGDRIVWTDHRAVGQNDIFMFDLTTMMETNVSNTGSPTNERDPAVSGGQIVWNLNGRPFADGIGLLGTSSISANGPEISADRVVWQNFDPTTGLDDIAMFDLVTMTETPVVTDPANQTEPAVSGNRIVWTDRRAGGANSDIFMFEIGVGETQITTDVARQESPAVSGDRIVWRDKRTGTGQIFMFDVGTMTETQITTTADVNSGVGISGDRIVWTDSRAADGNDDIYMFDLATMMETQITDEAADQNSPAISGDRIVWQDSRDGGGTTNIFMFEIAVGPPTPGDQVEDIADDVQDLLDAGDIPPEAGAELMEKLDVVVEKLDADKAAGAIRALSQFTSKVKNQEEKGQISTEDADALIAAAVAAIVAIADAAGRTFICHIKQEGVLSGSSVWLGKVIFTPDDQVPLHCTPHGKFGVTDHNPDVVNLGIGNACGRPKIVTAPQCEVGGISGI